MDCKCGLSPCTCNLKCICAENYGVNCPVHPVHICIKCNLPELQSDFKFGAVCFCKCSSDSLTDSELNQSISNIREDTSSTDNFQDNELPLATVSLDSSHSNIEFGSTHDQSQDTETSVSSMSDTSDCRTTDNNQGEQMNYLPIICSEEAGLVVEEKLPLNPSHEQSHDTETSESSTPDIYISESRVTVKNRTEQMDYLHVTPSVKPGLVVEGTLGLVAEETPLNPSHEQSHDTETSESSTPDISESGVTVKNRTEQMDYLQVTPSEEPGLVVEGTLGLVAEETPLNPSHAQSHTETSASSMPEVSGCRTKGNNRTEPMDNFATNQPSEEIELNAEETELLNSLNNFNDDQISHDPVNSANRVKRYVRILYQIIKNESLAASNSRYEANNAKKNASITQVSNSSSGRGVSGSPQVSFTGVVAAKPNLSTPPFPGCSRDSTIDEPFMCVPYISVRQKFVPPAPVTSGSSAKTPFYTDSATRRLQGHFSESAQSTSPTNPAFLKGSKNELSIPITPASNYSISKGVLPRKCGLVMRSTGRIPDWLKNMTTAPDNTHPPQEDSTCSASSSSSSPSPVELAKDATEFQNKTKSDKDTKATEPQSTVIASDESSSSFACSETTAHQESTSAEDTSAADLENKIIEQNKIFEESLNSCIDEVRNLSTSLREQLNIEETELKEPIQDSSKNS